MRVLRRAHRLRNPRPDSLDPGAAGGRAEPLERHDAPHWSEHRSIRNAGGDALDIRRG
jgi:hypothetical protein